MQHWIDCFYIILTNFLSESLDLYGIFNFGAFAPVYHSLQLLYELDLKIEQIEGANDVQFLVPSAGMIQLFFCEFPPECTIRSWKKWEVLYRANWATVCWTGT